VKNSEDFILILCTLRVQPNANLFSFNVVSLFTWVLIGKSLKLMSRQFDQCDVRVFHDVISSFFCFNGQFYEQTDGIAMGSQMSTLVNHPTNQKSN